METRAQPPAKDTIFDKIVRKEIPANIVYEDKHTIAFLDIHPSNPGHTLVVPKTPVRNIFDMDEETATHLFRAVYKLAHVVRDAVSAEGVNIIMNNEPAANQAVFHAHVHIVPRYTGDQLEPFPSREYEYPEQAGEIAEKIRAQLL